VAATMTREEEQKSIFEQHAQTLLTSVVLAAVVGAGALLVTLHNDVQVMKAQLTYLQDQLKTGVDDRFRGADWRREERVLNDRFERIERRVEKLEGIHNQ
jgi:hypothetical protein